MSAIKAEVGTYNKSTYFVGHSLGCQAIVRYLETLSSDDKIGGVVFVGGYFKKLTNIEKEGNEVVKIANKWLDAPIDFKKAKSHLIKSVAVFSDNDYYVPKENQKDFENKLGSKIIIQHNKGHFSGEDGINKLPVVLSSLVDMMGDLNEEIRKIVRNVLNEETNIHSHKKQFITKKFPKIAGYSIRYRNDERRLKPYWIMDEKGNSVGHVDTSGKLNYILPGDKVFHWENNVEKSKYGGTIEGAVRYVFLKLQRQLR